MVARKSKYHSARVALRYQGVSIIACLLNKQKKRKENKMEEDLSKKRKALYRILKNMKSRCFNKSFPDYKRYGERGIKVCDEWKNNSKSFIDWGIKNGYDFGLTIDRIENNGDYCPENCRWATRKEQAHNRRTNKWISYNGITLIQSEWEKFLGLKRGTLVKRISYGNTPEMAIRKSFG